MLCVLDESSPAFLSKMECGLGTISKILGHNFYSLGNVLSSVPASAMKSDTQSELSLRAQEKHHIAFLSCSFFLMATAVSEPGLSRVWAQGEHSCAYC
ncbi:hypothetical protein AAY473_024726 [Plecturocebus cupreus]